MKAITIYQPWANLIAQGEKTIETRSRATNYRGPLAILFDNRVKVENQNKRPNIAVKAEINYGF